MAKISSQDLFELKQIAVEALSKNIDFLPQNFYMAAFDLNNLPGIGLVSGSVGQDEATQRHLSRQISEAQGSTVADGSFTVQMDQHVKCTLVFEGSPAPFQAIFNKWLNQLPASTIMDHQPAFLTTMTQVNGLGLYVTNTLQVAYRLGQQSHIEAAEVLADFVSFYKREVFESANDKRTTRYAGEIDLGNNSMNISIIRILAAIKHNYTDSQVITVHLPKEHQNKEVFNKLCASFHLMNFDKVPGRCIQMRTEDDQLVMEQVLDKNFSLFFSRVGNWIDYSITPNTPFGAELLAILDPEFEN